MQIFPTSLISINMASIFPIMSWKMAEYINQLSEETVQRMADVYSEGLRLYFCTEPERPLHKEDRQCAFCHWFRADDPKSGGKFPGHGTGACDLPGSPRCASVGYYGGIPNKQFAYDHRADEALFLDGNYKKRRLGRHADGL